MNNNMILRITSTESHGKYIEIWFHKFRYSLSLLDDTCIDIRVNICKQFIFFIIPNRDNDGKTELEVIVSATTIGDSFDPDGLKRDIEDVVETIDGLNLQDLQMGTPQLGMVLTDTAEYHSTLQYNNNTYADTIIL